jgi:hypothetical protein
MELNITDIINNIDSFSGCYGSIAQFGNNAASYTWNNACDWAMNQPLKDQEHYNTLRNYFQSFGAWSKDELIKMDAVELGALLLQYILACHQEESPDFDTGHIFKTDEGHFYISLCE